MIIQKILLCLVILCLGYTQVLGYQQGYDRRSEAFGSKDGAPSRHHYDNSKFSDAIERYLYSFEIKNVDELIRLLEIEELLLRGIRTNRLSPEIHNKALFMFDRIMYFRYVHGIYIDNNNSSIAVKEVSPTSILKINTDNWKYWYEIREEPAKCIVWNGQDDFRFHYTFFAIQSDGSIGTMYNRSGEINNTRNILFHHMKSDEKVVQIRMHDELIEDFSNRVTGFSYSLTQYPLVITTDTGRTITLTHNDFIQHIASLIQDFEQTEWLRDTKGKYTSTTNNINLYQNYIDIFGKKFTDDVILSTLLEKSLYNLSFGRTRRLHTEYTLIACNNGRQNTVFRKNPDSHDIQAIFYDLQGNKGDIYSFNWTSSFTFEFGLPDIINFNNEKVIFKKVFFDAGGFNINYRQYSFESETEETLYSIGN